MIIVHDKRLPEEYLKKIRENIPEADLHAFGSSGAPYFTNMYDSIQNHPDIYFFQLDSKTIVHAKDLPETELEFLKEKNITLIRGNKNPTGKYPDTACYNAVRVGEAVLHNTEITDPAILQELKAKNLKPVHVSQGYTRCSVIPVGENALITPDEGIFNNAQGEGLEVLLISSGSVALSGQKHGFIGGASGVLPDGTMLFLGDVSKHPDFKKIEEFLDKHNTKYILLERLPLYDSGSLMIFDV